MGVITERERQKYFAYLDGVADGLNELSRDMEEIAEVINCDADAEAKCRMISNILTAKPHYFEKQEPSGDAVSRQAVLKTLDDMDNALDEDRTVENYKELLKECYEVLPSVNPQPCDDAVSRQAVKEQMIKYGFHAPNMTVTEFVEDLPFAKQEPSETIHGSTYGGVSWGGTYNPQEPNIDMESEKIKNLQKCAYLEGFHEALKMLVKQEPKAEQFAEWVATEIFDDNWEYNKDAFAELACRKLAKLGIVRAEGGEWILVEQEEGSDKE